MAQCYDWSSETQTVGKLPTDIWLQCPSGNTCCVGGSICLDHNLCHVPGSSSSTSGSYSSYYVARCSDPTYTSPDCQKVCDAPGPPDAVYNYTSQQWNCCGKDEAGNVSCDNPTSEIFQAPAPADLKELSTGVAIVSTATLAAGEKTDTSTSSSLASSTSSSTTSPTQTSSSSGSSITDSTSSTTSSPSQPQQTDSSPSSDTNSPTSSSTTTGLSTGAKAGIGIGVALAILALIALAFFLLRRRRRKNQAAAKSGPVSQLDAPAYGYADANAPAHAHAQYPSDKKGANDNVMPAAVEKSADGDRGGEPPRSELSSTNELVPGYGSRPGGMTVHELESSR